MADVFISYSKQQPQHTAELAADLEARGISVWWDTKLIAGRSYSEAIEAQIRAAKAVIVIWPPAGPQSDWIYAEADLARTQGKLVSVLGPGVGVLSLRLPFSALHASELADRPAILAALAGLGVTVDTVEERWHQIADTRDVALLGDFANAHAGHARAQDARLRIGKLVDEEARAWNEIRNDDMPHKFHAFLRAWPHGAHQGDATARLAEFGFWGTLATYAEASVVTVFRMFALGMVGLVALAGAVLAGLPALAVAGFKMGPVIALQVVARNAEQLVCGVVTIKLICACPDGMVRDAATNSCRPMPVAIKPTSDGPAVACPLGLRFDPVTAKCRAIAVPLVLPPMPGLDLATTCPPGSRWNVLMKSCRPDGATTSTMELLCTLDRDARWNAATSICEKRNTGAAPR